jgi:hypothetical protein
VETAEVPLVKQVKAVNGSEKRFSGKLNGEPRETYSQTCLTGATREDLESAAACRTAAYFSIPQTHVKYTVYIRIPH